MKTEIPTEEELEQSNYELHAAGFMTVTAGPINWFCYAKFGDWCSRLQRGLPFRWDLVLEECKQVFPERFANGRRDRPNE